MSDPMTYSFYGTTVPVLRNTATSAISILTAAKNEISSAADGTFPSEAELLDTHFGNMLPLRMQPILLAKFQVVALQHLQLNGSTPIPALETTFSSFDSVIEFFKGLQAVFDAVDEKTFNESAEKGVDVPIGSGPSTKTLHMTGLADYFHSFVVPNSYFHLNAMYMLLRNQGFALGKGVYVGCFMSEQQKKDWAPLRG
ncbi:Nn.00g021040.m01.CDS01 [Neocucurbitaria sp. VM-36]